MKISKRNKKDSHTKEHFDELTNLTTVNSIVSNELNPSSSF